MQIRRPLSNLERLCTFCNKDVNIKKDDYIATQGKDRRYRRYRLAHRSCYNDYLDYVKKIWR